MNRQQKGFRNPAPRWIARRRKMCGLTQHALAEATGIAVSRIVFAETGRLDLEPTEIETIRNVLRQRARKVMAACA